ncbi:hypothetical protein HK097_003478 [Rhizophlyctis rosea]|uniref:Uncharacterized protein n=1 Tax=Rhizophlyctis rosea TaxID=64517 RepID=A0AAD5SMC7_9FUNG|nr:hypothetical protein HK097_003478 [Rhizophlyctis rosea]
MPPKPETLTHNERKAQLQNTITKVNEGRGDATNQFALYNNLDAKMKRVLYVVLPSKLTQTNITARKRSDLIAAFHKHLPNNAENVPKDKFILHDESQQMLKAELDRKKAKESQRIDRKKREAEADGTNMAVC